MPFVIDDRPAVALVTLQAPTRGVHRYYCAGSGRTYLTEEDGSGLLKHVNPDDVAELQADGFTDYTGPTAEDMERMNAEMGVQEPGPGGR